MALFLPAPIDWKIAAVGHQTLEVRQGLGGLQRQLHGSGSDERQPALTAGIALSNHVPAANLSKGNGK
jgi:hypothetical protein